MNRPDGGEENRRRKYRAFTLKVPYSRSNGAQRMRLDQARRFPVSKPQANSYLKSSIDICVDILSLESDLEVFHLDLPINFF